MKNRTIMCLLGIIFSVVLFQCDNNSEAKCIPYAKTENFIHCYYSEPIKYSDDRFVKVLIKATTITEEGKEKKIFMLEARGLSTKGRDIVYYDRD